MKHAKPMVGVMNWIGEMPIAEGEWVGEHKKQTGREPSFFT